MTVLQGNYTGSSHSSSVAPLGNHLGRSTSWGHRSCCTPYLGASTQGPGPKAVIHTYIHCFHMGFATSPKSSLLLLLIQKPHSFSGFSYTGAQCRLRAGLPLAIEHQERRDLENIVNFVRGEFLLNCQILSLLVTWSVFGQPACQLVSHTHHTVTAIAMHILRLGDCLGDLSNNTPTLPVERSPNILSQDTPLYIHKGPNR